MKIAEPNLLTLDYWRDEVSYQGIMRPSGTIGCAVLNISDDVIEKLKQISHPLQAVIEAVGKKKTQAGTAYTVRLAFYKLWSCCREKKRSLCWIIRITLSNHFLVFERNDTSVPFVVPDYPVTIMKATEDETVFNFRFPLTPFLQVFLIDPRSADAITNNQYRNKIRRITPDHFQIVDSWNWLSLSEAKRFVYYPPDYMCKATPRGAVFRHR